MIPLPAFDTLGLAPAYSCRAAAGPVSGTLRYSFPPAPAATRAGLLDALSEWVFALERALDFNTPRVLAEKHAAQHDLFAVVEAAGRPAWTGRFTGGPTPDYASGLWALPDPHRLLAAAGGNGYVVKVDDPLTWERAAVAPVLGVRRVAGLPLVVVWDFQRLAAYGPEGVVWRHDRLADDDLEVTDASSAGVHARGVVQPALNGERTTFDLDPLTGALRSPA